MTAARLAATGRFAFDIPEQDVQPVSSLPQTPRGLTGALRSPAWPAMLGAVYWLLGPTACAWVNPLLGSLGTFLTYAVVRSIAGTRTAVASSCLLAVNAVWIDASNGAMSDLPAAVLALLAMALACVAVEAGDPRRRTLALCAAGAASSDPAFLVRFPGALAILAPLARILAGPGSRKARARDAAVLAAPFALVSALILPYQLAVHGTLHSHQISATMPHLSAAHLRDGFFAFVKAMTSLRLVALFLPALLGLGLLLARSPARAAIFATWTLPVIALHALLPGGDDAQSLRLFLMSVPAQAALAAFALVVVVEALTASAPRLAPLLLTLLVAVSSIAALREARASLAAADDRYLRVRALDRMASSAPEGATILAMRNKLATLAFLHPRRWELLAVNQAKASGPVAATSLSDAWRDRIVIWPADWRVLAPNNQRRIERRLGEGRRVFLLLDRKSEDACKTAIGRTLTITEAGPKMGVYALFELTPRGVPASAVPPSPPAGEPAPSTP
ncbi:MAG: glycosyltransferase family 39 protein [Acidobacteriota bacterium]